MVLPEAGAELGNNAVLSEVSTEDDCPQDRVHNLHLGFQVVFPSPCFSFAPDRMASLVIVLQIALICIRRKEAGIRFQECHLLLPEAQALVRFAVCLEGAENLTP